MNCRKIRETEFQPLGDTLKEFTITPKVDEVHEFLEIAADFTDPLEVVREAISNSLDANATEVSIEFSTIKQLGAHVLLITIRDNGDGMGELELQSFFDLGNSPKRLNKQQNANTIGEKGHGTKVYFRCSSISVATCRDGTLLDARMENPYAQLHDGHLPLVTVTRTESANRSNGTKLSIKGFNNNQLEKFTHDRIKDYVKWKTKFGSIETTFGIRTNSSKKLLLKGLDRDAPEEIPFGHVFPEDTKDLNSLFTEHVVRAPDYYCKKIARPDVLKKFPHIKYDAIFSIEGNKIKQTYNPMIRRQGYSAPAGGYTVAGSDMECGCARISSLSNGKMSGSLKKDTSSHDCTRFSIVRNFH
jgi:hypothetical protein